MPLQFDETANGSEVELSAGDKFELSLSETRTAGYRWTLKSTGEPSCILLSESSQPASGQTGGTGTHLWRFRAVAPGNCLLALEYRRSWESSSEPARTFGMKVRVRP
jgi:predicted secreted protein